MDHYSKSKLLAASSVNLILMALLYIQATHVGMKDDTVAMKKSFMKNSVY